MSIMILKFYRKKKCVMYWLHLNILLCFLLFFSAEEIEKAMALIKSTYFSSGRHTGSESTCMSSAVKRKVNIDFNYIYNFIGYKVN